MVFKRTPVQPGEATPKDYNKVKAVAILSGKYGLHVLAMLTGGLVSVASLAGMEGMGGTAALSLANVGLSLLNEKFDENEPDLSALKNNFQQLKSKLDDYHGKQRFDRWIFHDTRKDISAAWEMFVTMATNAVQENDEDHRLKHIKEFVDKHEPKYIYDLHVLLTERGNKFE